MLSYHARYFKAPVFLALRTSSPQPAFLFVLRTALALSLLVPWYAKAIEYAQMQSAWSSFPRAFSSVFTCCVLFCQSATLVCFGYGDMRMCSVRVGSCLSSDWQSATFCLSFVQIDGAATLFVLRLWSRANVLTLAIHWNPSPVVAQRWQRHVCAGFPVTVCFDAVVSCSHVFFANSAHFVV